MARNTPLLAAATALGFLARQATSQNASTSVTAVFYYGAHPASLEASVVAINTDTASDIETWTYEVSCPTAASPDNDACRSGGLYPAHVYHVQGSVFGGTITGPGTTTTTWSCALSGGGWCDTCSLSANCVNTAAGATTITGLDNCDALARSVPVVITAGLEQLGTYAYNTLDVAQLTSIYASQLSAGSCPTSALMASATAGVNGTAKETTGTTTTPGPSASGSSTASSTASTASSGQGLTRPGWSFWASSLLAMAAAFVGAVL